MRPREGHSRIGEPMGRHAGCKRVPCASLFSTVNASNRGDSTFPIRRNGDRTARLKEIQI